jgi:hypothetical protein
MEFCMNLEELLAMWDQDANIDEEHLDRESVNNSKLHSKYLRHLMYFKSKHIALQTEYNLLRQKKFKYYRGEFTRDELIVEGWSQFQGTKPLKSEMEERLQGDADLNRLTMKISYVKLIIESIESIMNQIKAKDWEIKNAIAFKVFLAGG